jgi:rubrerythrin
MSIHLFIHDEHGYNAAMSIIDGYIRKGFAHLTAEEESHLEKLSKAVEEWERKKYPMPV